MQIGSLQGPDQGFLHTIDLTCLPLCSTTLYLQPLVSASFASMARHFLANSLPGVKGQKITVEKPPVLNHPVFFLTFCFFLVSSCQFLALLIGLLPASCSINILSQPLSTLSISCCRYLSVYPESRSRAENSLNISAFSDQGTSSFVFLKIRRPYCVKDVRFTEADRADSAGMSCQFDIGFR